MHTRMMITLGAVSICTSVAQGGIADFYLLGASGKLYSVNGNTLQATEHHQIANGGSVVEMLDLGNGEVMINRAFEMYRYNFHTQQATSMFSHGDVADPHAFGVLSGLAHDGNGGVFFSMSQVTPSQPATQYYGNTYDIGTGTVSRMAQYSSPGGAYFDHHMIGQDLYLSANISAQTVDVLNAQTGLLENQFAVGIEPVSFFEISSQVYMITQFGEIHTLDITTGATGFVGQITGFEGSLIGADVLDPARVFPTPGSAMVLGFAGIAASRRRR